MTWLGTAPSGHIWHATLDETIFGAAALDGDTQGLLETNTVVAIQGSAVNSATPLDGYVLIFDGSEYVPSGLTLGGSTHNLLSGTHNNTTTATATRGDIIVANASNLWDELALGTQEFVLFSDGTDATYTRLGAVTPFSLGAVGTPSVTFTGDLDTGLSAAAADILIASAGGSAIATFDGVNTKLVLTGGQVVGFTSEGVSTTLDTTDYVTFVTASPVDITLPAAPTNGEVHYIKDSAGNATASNRITIAGNGNNIDGNTNIQIKNTYGSFTLIYNGTQWNVL